MKKTRWVLLAFALILIPLVVLAACSAGQYEEDEEDYYEEDYYCEIVFAEAGRVVLISNGIEHDAYRHFLGDMRRFGDSYISASGFPFQEWIGRPEDWGQRELLEALVEIPYADDFQIVIEGGGRFLWAEISRLEHDEVELLWMPRTMDFELWDDEAGVFLWALSVTWSGPGRTGMTNQYVFKIVK